MKVFAVVMNMKVGGSIGNVEMVGVFQSEIDARKFIDSKPFKRFDYAIHKCELGKVGSIIKGGVGIGNWVGDHE